MTSSTHTAAAWVYRGIWGILTRWFRVPQEPPTLPFHDSATVEAFRPADAYLRYLKLQFWIVATVMTVAILIAWGMLLVALPIAGLALAVPAALAVLGPNLTSYIALHLRFDATWYVLTDRSLRIRRGIWVIRETTITFENIQNVTVNQGPLQRLFGVSSVVVQTAGGGSARGPHGEDALGPHAGVLEGLDDAPRIRDLILARLTASKSTGLGDEAHAHERQPLGAHSGAWSPAHVALLREIRDRARAMA